MAIVGSNLFFTADDSTHGAELWVDDVATGATQLVKDINPGAAGSDPADFVVFNNLLYFSTNDGSAPTTNQLWSSDGTAANTKKVASFSPGVTKGASVFYGSAGADVVLGSHLLLPLDDGVRGTALWSTDGTAAGTTMLARFDPSSFATLNGTAYFLGTANSKFGLWSTNATAAGTTEVKDLSSQGSSTSYYGYGNSLVAVGGRLYFSTDDGNGGTDLWSSDGTPGGTAVVTDFSVPAGGVHYDVRVSDLTALGNKLVFIADDGTHGSQVWVSNGTPAGTQMLTSVNATPSSGSTIAEGADPGSLVVAGTRLYFEADAPSASITTTEGLWVTDGTPGGTTEITTIPAMPIPNETSSAQGTMSNLTAVGSNLFFSVSYSFYNGQTDVNVVQLWTSNGTAGGTTSIAIPAAGSDFTSLSDFNAVGNRLLFEAVDSSGATALWASDGTASGTTLLKVVNPSSSYSYYHYYSPGNGASLVADGVLYFTAGDGNGGDALWQSDGTAAGTYQAADFPSASTDSSSSPIPLGVLNGQLVLFADDGLHGSELMTLAASSQAAAPGLTAIPDQDVTAGETLALDLRPYAYDPNSPGLPLTYHLTGTVPTGASIDAKTGILTWATPADEPIGPTSLTITVSDNSSPPLTASETFTVDVDAVAPPSIAAIPTQNVGVGHTFKLDVSADASDPNFPAYALTYSLGAAPTGATINPNTGVLTWATASNQAITGYSFTVNVSDDSPLGQPASQTFTVNVNAVYPPFVETIPTQGLNVGQTLTVNLSRYVFDDSDPSLPLTYSLGANPPSGASINATTGVLTWTPASNQSTGTISIPFSASDNSTPANTTSGTVSVELGTPGTVRPPVIAAVPATRVVIGQTLNDSVSSFASDPNSPALPLTYSLGPGAPAGATIDATTGEITWTTAANQAVGPYSFPFIVSDDNSPALTATGTLTVNVVGSETILGPIVMPLPIADVVIGGSAQVNVSSYASDPNTPPLPLTYSLGAGAPSTAAINPATGVLTFTPAPSQATGQVQIEILVSDDLSPPDTSTAFWDVNVFAAGSEVPPLVQPLPARTAVVDQDLKFNISQYASDPNTPALPLTYSLAFSPPSGASINATTGLFDWTPASNQAGTASIFVQVADNESPPKTTTVEFSVTVYTYSPPVFQTIPAQTATIGTPYSLNVSQYVSDPNTPALPLAYSLTGFTIPSGMSINPSTGILTWTPASYQAGTASITVKVSDSQSPSASASETFVLNATGRPATFSPIPNQSATIGQELDLSLSTYARDPNSPPEGLTYSLGSGAPSGAAISSTGEFTWTPPASQPIGSIPITVIVADKEDPGQTVSQTFNVSVSAAPIVPPTIESISTSTAVLGKTFTSDISQYASDPNTTPFPLTYTLAAGAPPGAGIDATTGKFTWTPAAGQATGTYAFTVAVSDNESPPLTSVAGFSVVLSATVINPPVLQPIPAQSATIGQPFSLNVSHYASDPNTPPLPLTYRLTGTVPSGANIGATDGVLNWTPSPGQPTGATSITVMVSDNSSPPNTVSETITVDVFAIVVHPPVLGAIPAQSATIGAPFSLNVAQYASDPNSPPRPLTYSLGSGAPAGASINPTSGIFTWTPSSSQPIGTASITIVVSDNNSPPLTASGTLTIDIAGSTVIHPAVLAAIPAQTADVGQGFQLDISSFASDPNTPPLPLTYSLGTGAPSGVAINPSTGLLTWTIGANQTIGTYPIAVQVSDNESPPRTTSETFNVNVVDPGPPPSIASATASTKKGLTITLTFSGAVNPVTAANAANYTLTAPAKKPKGKHKPTPPPTPVGFSLNYSAATNQVTIKAAKKPKAGTVLTLTVIGTGPTGIAKLDGLQLAGSGGQPGTNYVATIRGKAVSPTAAVTGNPIWLQPAARLAGAGLHAGAAAKRLPVRVISVSRHPVTIGSVRPAGPLALRTTPVVPAIVLGVIPTASNQSRRVRHG